MSFNFKEALEELEYSKTCKKKAEDFLKLVIESLKAESIFYSDIENLCFTLLHPRHTSSYIITVSYLKKGKITDTERDSICKMKIANEDEANEIFLYIIRILWGQGFQYKDMSEKLNKLNPDYIKVFNILIH